MYCEQNCGPLNFSMWGCCLCVVCMCVYGFVFIVDALWTWAVFELYTSAVTHTDFSSVILPRSLASVDSFNTVFHSFSLKEADNLCIVLCGISKSILELLHAHCTPNAMCWFRLHTFCQPSHHLIKFCCYFFTVTLNKCVLFAVSLMVFATSAKFSTSLHASNRRW